MYKAENIGIHRGRLTYEKYHFFPGQIIDAPNGDLYGFSGVRWIGDEPERELEIKKGVEIIYPENSPE